MGIAKTDRILFSEHNGVGVITLNRPEALHALTHGMIRRMEEQLQVWAEDSAVKAVLVESSGGRAFCAGGDIKSVAEAEPEVAIELFRDEYTLNYRIFTFPKPYIALVDGIVMGGGVGVSAHGRYRVVTENTVFAMPEVAIGFFPDVGMGYRLARYPASIGTYLALTAQRIGAVDCMYTGYATHYVPSARMPELRAALLQAPEAMEATLARFTAVPEGVAGTLEARRADIAACFGGSTVAEIMEALVSHGSAWALEQAEVMRRMCPFSMTLALEQLQRSASLSFREVMIMEYRISRACICRGDFREGVRALLIDKGSQPQWSPATLEEVSALEIARCFEGLAQHDLVLPA